MSKIEWTEKTWNPVVGCQVLSPGCTNCYAMTMAARLQDIGHASYQGLTQRHKGKAVWTGKTALNEKALLEPLKRKKPTVYFVDSMADLFFEGVPDDWIDRVFAVMALCPQHRFIVLTKRAQRMREYLQGTPAHMSEASERIGYRIMEMMPEEEVAYPAHWGATASALIHGPTPDDPRVAFPRPNIWPLPNVILGVSVEDQRRAEERIPLLLDTPAACRAISAEPLLGQVNLHWISTHNGECLDSLRGEREDGETSFSMKCNKLDWVICGGESGPDARVWGGFYLAARSLRDQCQAADVPFFFKQWGEWAPYDRGEVDGSKLATPNSLDQPIQRFGKKAAGRTLDGAIHDGFPPLIAEVLEARS